jgi:hypothetical protein
VLDAILTMATTTANDATDTRSNNDNNDRRATHQSKDEDFKATFGPLAHHFFPDGCPETSSDPADNDTDNIASVWPLRQDRTPVAPADALASMALLQKMAHREGFTAPQLSAIAVTACATLPSSGSHHRHPGSSSSSIHSMRPGSVSVGAGSPLVDGSSRHFQSLVQCLIPAAVFRTDKSNSDDNNKVNNSDSIPASVVGMLFSVATSAGVALTITNDSKKDDDSTQDAQVSCVLRFFTLAVRQMGALDADARKRLDVLYNVMFGNCLLTPTTTTTTTNTVSLSAATRVTDAVRLLLAMTKKRHVRADRIRKLQACLERLTTTATAATTITPNKHRRVHSALSALLQLYVRYNNHNNEHNNAKPFFRWNEGSSLAYQSYDWFAVPDHNWAQAFAGHSNDTMTATTHVQEKHSLTTRPAKRSRLDQQYPTKEAMPKHSTPESAVHLLLDADLRHALLLSNTSSNSNSTNNGGGTNNGGVASAQETETVIRLRTCLPYMLHEEWYQYGRRPANTKRDNRLASRSSSEARNGNDPNDDPMEEETTANTTADTFATGSTSMAASCADDDGDTCRLRLLEALADFATHTDALPLEAEQFVLRDILPLWDGTDATSQLLCYDILPALQPCTFSDLRSRLLRHLERLFIYGSARIQYAIISGTLASLVNRWGRLDWSVASTSHCLPTTTTGGDSSASTEDMDAMKIQTLRELIHWTDDLILKGFLLDGGGHELLRAAAIDFFAAVCDLTDHCTFLAAPSPSIAYRLLLSKSALHVDRVCHLLVKYKVTFQKLKQRQEQEARTDDAVSGLDRVKIFNCFVWDFCSVLWRCSPPPSPHHVSGKESSSSSSSSRTLSILYTDLRPETQSQLYAAADKVASTLSITHSAVFAGYASAFLKTQLPDQPNPSPDLIRGKLKVKYLDYLKTSCGMEGIHSFLSSFVGSLANRSSRRLQRQQKDNNQS